MGKTTFVVRVASREDVVRAMLDIARHNATEPARVGQYTPAEFLALDPMRAKVFANLPSSNGMHDVSVHVGAMERWTRGEDLDTKVVLVRHAGELWLETTNGGGGACSTSWLRENSTLPWIGTSPKKPSGFYDSPAVGRAANTAEAVRVFEKHA